MPSASPRRFLHLWFNRLPTDRLARQIQDRPATPIRRNGASDLSAAAPIALIYKVKSALRLQAVDDAAKAQGLQVGMTLADARALVPELQVQEADFAGDLGFLEHLAQVCRRYTPSLALDPPDGLNLDVTGVADLFGGEAGLMADLAGRLKRMDLSVASGLADTPGLAWAVARFGAGDIAPLGARHEVLASLPLDALRLESETTAVLGRLGLKRVGQLLDMSRASLTRRFGETLLQHLDEALGLRASPLSLKLEIPPFRAERRLAEPIDSEELILIYINILAELIYTQLEARGVGARRFRLELFRMDGAVKTLEVCSSQPLRQADRVTALFTERLAGLNEGLEADFGFDLLRLWAAGVQPWVAQTLDLLSPDSATTEFATLVDRIAARSGLQVLRLMPRNVHQPEHAGVLAPFEAAQIPAWAGKAGVDEPALSFGGVPLRPARLFAPPQPIEVTAAEVPDGPPARFQWRRVQRRVVRAEGPERIEPEWGREGSEQVARDYYRLEDQDGRRYWVFRQGLYGAATARTEGPRWFLHGLFG